MTLEEQLAQLEQAMLEKHQAVEELVQKANAQIIESGKATTKVMEALDKAATQANDIGERLFALEQGGSTPANPEAKQSPGAALVESPAFKMLAEGNANKARISINAAITNGTGTGQPLVEGDRLPGIVHGPNRRLRIRDLIMTQSTSSNLIEFAVENVFTNAAATQENEGDQKAESDITFTLQTAPVVTIAHFLKVSKQVIEDSAGLQGYINGRLTYGLALKEEQQILNGDGSSGQLNGLRNQQTAFTGVATDSKVDQVRRAICQAELSDYLCTGILLNTQDWCDIELDKGTDGHYTHTNPATGSQPMLWGLPVVASNSIPAGNFQVGAYDMAAGIHDREASNVEISTEDGDNFTKNMCTIRAEERLALAVYRPTAIVGGPFAASA